MDCRAIKNTLYSAKLFKYALSTRRCDDTDSEKGCLNVDYAFFSTQERHQATFSTSKPLNKAQVPAVLPVLV